ncbi:HNH endonuclease [Paenibacillus sp. UNC499MF]|uniref:HNH endonuclease n=1 Tax=Paenibacillus sp. UNC499MF TaxID=1502751 RepID=UPI00089F9A74|nr:HNH endonuclease domain-containing protein [Paenibacillus sp. UNC499MF]SEG75543.1 HNH endonuclease [Paenibacillus sp. UNC499MF]
MNINYSKDNDIVRAALYLEYGGKCFYEGLPLRFKEMHIDHIIPESINNEELQGIISELSLPIDFKINSLYNLVPCFPNVNQVKNKNQYPHKFLGHCIYDGTAKKVEGVKKRIEQLSKEYKNDKELAKLIARLNISENKKDLEELYNALSKEKPFELKRKINKDENSYTYERSFPNIRLAAILPTYPEMKGSCLITFSNLRLRDCMISLNHKQIMDQLFEGAKSKLENKLRSFVNFSEEIEPNTYYVNLANVRLPLVKNEVVQLLEIIDDVYDLYMEESALLYKSFNRDIFESTGSGNRLRLFKIKRQLWFALQKFCKHFDYANGDSDWHIFDASGSMLKVYDKIKEEFRLFVFPQVEQKDFLIAKDDDVWLVWTDEFYWNIKLSNFESNDCWSPLFSYQWLVTELIPQVMFWNESGNEKMFRKRQSIEEFKKRFDLTTYVSSMPNLTNEEALLDFVSNLQKFFHIRPHNTFQLNELSVVYGSLIKIIEKTNISSSEIHYVSGKLNLRNISDKETLLQGISTLLLDDKNEESVISSFSLDLIFRCMVVVLRDCKNSLSLLDTREIKCKLNKYYNLMIQETVRSKL